MYGCWKLYHPQKKTGSSDPGDGEVQGGTSLGPGTCQPGSTRRGPWDALGPRSGPLQPGEIDGKPGFEVLISWDLRWISWSLDRDFVGIHLISL